MIHVTITMGRNMTSRLERLATRIQYRGQLALARSLLHWHQGPITLWLIDYRDQRPRRVSITGGIIVESMVDVWRIAGARCHRIGQVSR